MKSLLVSVLLFAFAQTASAVDLGEAQAKKLYDILAYYKGTTCENGRCSAAAHEIKCIYHWKTKDYHPENIYWCSL